MRSADLAIVPCPVPKRSAFAMVGWFVWCGSMVRTDDGICHLFFSRWRSDLGFQAWVTHSEVAHAVARDPLGPYTFVDVTLAGRGGRFWDADAIHNPCVIRHGGRFHLYYMGNHGNGDWWTHRNNQRIGVAVADAPDGPWRRFDKPLIDVTPGEFDHLIATNPAVTVRPDGGILMIYKTVSAGEMPFGGKVHHAVAFADSPLGPFRRHPEPVLGHPTAKFAAEDPFVWHDGERYRAIIKDQEGFFTQAGRSLALFESADGIAWTLSAQPLVSDRTVTWEDGETFTAHYLERPWLHLADGAPHTLFCAMAPDDRLAWTCNLQMPLRPPRTRAAPGRALLLSRQSVIPVSML